MYIQDKVTHGSDKMTVGHLKDDCPTQPCAWSRSYSVLDYITGRFPRSPPPWFLSLLHRVKGQPPIWAAADFSNPTNIT